MKILTRWNDKVTYYIIIITIILCFIASLGIWIWGLIGYYSFWNDIIECVANQDYDCLLLQISKKQALLNSIRELTAFNLSFISLFLSVCCLSLYKFKYRS